MTFFINPPPSTVSIKARGTDTPLTGFWGGVSAATERGMLEANAYFRRGRERIQQQDMLAVEAARFMGADRIGQMVEDFNARARAAGMQERQVPEDLGDLPSIFGPNFSKAVLDAARQDPEWAGPDVSDEVIEQRMNDQFQKEKRDLAETLATMPGGANRPIAEIVGAVGADLLDVRKWPFLVAGGAPGSFARIMGREAMLNVAAEGVTMPDRFDMAKRLDIPEPDVAMTLAYAAAGGAILGGAVEGLARGITYWRGTRTGKPSDRVATFDQQLNADIAEDAIADLKHPFEHVRDTIVETPRPLNLRLEDFADQSPLSGLRVDRPTGERVTLGFDDWVTPPAAGGDVRLPRASTALPSARPRPDMSQVVERLEAHQIDAFARNIDAEAFAQRDALLDLARRRRAEAGEAVPRYEADRAAARDGAVQEIDRLEAELAQTKGKKAPSELRSRIQQAKADLVEIESLQGQVANVTDKARLAALEADQALMARMGDLAPRISAARAQAAAQIGDAPSPSRGQAEPALERVAYDTAVAEYEASRRHAAAYGRELDEAMFQMPAAPSWVDMPKERETIAAYQTDDLRTWVERDGDRMIGDRSVSSILDELDADDEFVAVAELCGRRSA